MSKATGIIAIFLIAMLAAISWVAGTEKTQLDSATVDSVMQMRQLDSLHKKIQEDMNNPEFRRKLFEQELKPEDVK